MTKVKGKNNMTKCCEKGNVSIVVSGEALEDMTFHEAKQLAYLTAKRNYGITMRHISESVGLPLTNVKRGLSDPTYHPSIPNIPDYCEAMGNTILIEWQAAQSGCYLVKVEAEISSATLAECVSRVMSESSDVLSVFAKAIKDGTLTLGEVKTMESELVELATVTHAALEATRVWKQELFGGE